MRLGYDAEDEDTYNLFWNQLEEKAKNELLRELAFAQTASISAVPTPGNLQLEGHS